VLTGSTSAGGACVALAVRLGGLEAGGVSKESDGTVLASVRTSRVGAGAGEEGRRVAVDDPAWDATAGACVVGRGGVRVEGAAAGVSAWRVTVPLRLKFCSSRGPIASEAGVFVVDWGKVWAAASVGQSASPAVKSAAIAKRRIALIVSVMR